MTTFYVDPHGNVFDNAYSSIPSGRIDECGNIFDLNARFPSLPVSRMDPTGNIFRNDLPGIGPIGKVGPFGFGSGSIFD